MKLRNSLFSVLLLILFSLNGHTHQKSQSYTLWTIANLDEGLEVSVSTKINKSILANQLVNSGYRLDGLKGYFFNKIYSDDCESNNDGFIKDFNTESYIIFSESFVCSSREPYFSFDLFFDLNISHIDFSSRILSDKKLSDFIITRDLNKIKLSHEELASDSPLSFISFIKFGFEHILSGIDHIAFLIMIIFLSSGLRNLLIAISGFTIGHSISLFASVQNFIVTSGVLVEIMIGFSIFICALEYIGRQTNQLQRYAYFGLIIWSIFSLFSYLQSDLPVLFFIGLGLMLFSYLRLSETSKNLRFLIFITIIFGFIHGLGFAGAISEINLPGNRLLGVVLAFNLGIELGQILIFFICLLSIFILSKILKPQNIEHAKVLVSLAVFGYGLNLLIERSFLQI